MQLATKAVTASVLNGVGDSIAQLGFETGPFNWKRLAVLSFVVSAERGSGRVRARRGAQHTRQDTHYTYLHVRPPHNILFLLGHPDFPLPPRSPIHTQGLALIGPSLHFWYGILGKYVKFTGVAGTLTRLALDQLFFAPIFLSSIVGSIMTLEVRCGKLICVQRG
jgi:hypothetical protein